MRSAPLSVLFQRQNSNADDHNRDRNDREPYFCARVPTVQHEDRDGRQLRIKVLKQLGKFAEPRR